MEVAVFGKRAVTVCDGFCRSSPSKYEVGDKDCDKGAEQDVGEHVVFGPANDDIQVGVCGLWSTGREGF